MIFSGAILDTELGKSMSKAQLQRSLREGWEGWFILNHFPVEIDGFFKIDNRLKFQSLKVQFSASEARTSTPQASPEYLCVTVPPRYWVVTLTAGLLLTGLARPRVGVDAPRDARENQARCQETPATNSDPI